MRRRTPSWRDWFSVETVRDFVDHELPRWPRSLLTSLLITLGPWAATAIVSYLWSLLLQAMPFVRSL